ncbi:MAG: hypothetical protein RIM84_20365 [Alphaproteobacteria bacterium]
MKTSTNTRRTLMASLLGLGLLALPAMLPGDAAARVVQVGSCSQAVGPFNTQNQAFRVLREARARGYATGPVYGQGGVVSRYSNRRWYFTVYYAC